MKSQENVLDTVETLLLMTLEATHSQYIRDVPVGRSKERTIMNFDQGKLLQIDEMKPASAFTCEIGNAERDFTSDPALLMTHPGEILGDESEVMVMYGDGHIMWRGFRRLNRPPKGLAIIGKYSHLYEVHVRKVEQDGGGLYMRRIVPLDRHGNALAAALNGLTICNPRNDGGTLTLSASIIEDALRAGTMLASVAERNEIKFPIALDAYQEAFALRDAPLTPSGRKKAIVHWVSKHLRRSREGRAHEVRRHTRGLEQFVIDGFTVRLSPNDK